MNRKSKIYILLLVWTAAVVQFFINKGIDREEKMIEAIALYDVTEYESEISAYGFYGNGYISEGTREQMLIRLAEKLGVTSDYEITAEHSLDGDVVSFRKKGLEGDTLIQLVTMKEETSGSYNYENYLSMEIRLHQKVDLSYAVRQEIEELYLSLGIEPTMNLYVGGVKPGGISDEEMKRQTAEFFDLMKADFVCEEQFDNVYTIYGYSSELDDFVYQNDEKVNVNIAFVYDESNDRTQIHMAVPFVDRSY